MQYDLFRQVALIIHLNFIFTFSQSNFSYLGPCLPDLSSENQQDVQKKKKLQSIRGRKISCTGGFVSQYPCRNIALNSYISLSDLEGKISSSAMANDIWGWTNVNDGREFALVGLSSGTSFVEITDAINPIVIGFLPSFSGISAWRDIKTYKNYAYIVSEAFEHGMQVFDLKQLLSASNTTFSSFQSTPHYSGFSTSHNLFINEVSGYAYSVGTNTCGGGLHIIDIREPSKPVFSGCFASRGYTHDVQCVIYDGPDKNYNGKEICFASNENNLDIVDVTDKENPVLISTFHYNNFGYIHQGWLTEDKHFYLIDDEYDEFKKSANTSTIICNVSNLTNPIFVGIHTSTLKAIDHNQYVKGNFVYQANYRAGLRILDINHIHKGYLVEVAYFDSYPKNDDSRWTGAWSNFPYFDSGNVILSDTERGLFILDPTLIPAPPTNSPRPTSRQSVKPSNILLHKEEGREIFVTNLEAYPSITCDREWRTDIFVKVSDDTIDVLVEGIDKNDENVQSCKTRINGHCSLSFYGLSMESITFEIVSLSKNGYIYNASKNIDYNGNSDGTFITVTKSMLQSNSMKTLLRSLVQLIG